MAQCADGYVSWLADLSISHDDLVSFVYLPEESSVILNGNVWQEALQLYSHPGKDEGLTAIQSGCSNCKQLHTFTQALPLLLPTIKRLSLSSKK